MKACPECGSHTTEEIRSATEGTYEYVCSNDEGGCEWNSFPPHLHEETYHCEGCEQDLPIDDFGNHEELCNICLESAYDKAEYLASVNAYLNEDRRRGI